MTFTLPGTGPAGEEGEQEKLVLSIGDDVSAVVKPGVKVDVDSVLSVTGLKPDAVRLDDYRPGSPARHTRRPRT